VRASQTPEVLRLSSLAVQVLVGHQVPVIPPKAERDRWVDWVGVLNKTYLEGNEGDDSLSETQWSSNLVVILKKKVAPLLPPLTKQMTAHHKRDDSLNPLSTLSKLLLPYYHY
ncbi:hypothetical protein HAX54_017851, partial [Datura stramonium]|nr:hypothetical protein [Datura stramonium]